MSADKGYIKIYRDIRDHWIWKDKPYDKARAWIDLIMSANHAPKKILFDGQLTTVDKGQHITSIDALANRWGWSRSKVRRFLKMLEAEHMVNHQRIRRGMLITLVKYSAYQEFKKSSEHSGEPSDDTSYEPSHEPSDEPSDGHKQYIKENTIESTKKHEEGSASPDPDFNPWDVVESPEEEEAWLNG